MDCTSKGDGIKTLPPTDLAASSPQVIRKVGLLQVSLLRIIERIDEQFQPGVTMLIFPHLNWSGVDKSPAF